jgi:hypothetical protein
MKSIPVGCVSLHASNSAGTVSCATACSLPSSGRVKTSLASCSVDAALQNGRCSLQFMRCYAAFALNTRYAETGYTIKGKLTKMTAASQTVKFNPYSQAIPQERHRRSLNLIQVHVGRRCPCNPRERLLVCLTNDVYSTSWAEVSTEQPNNHRTLARSLLQPPHPSGRRWQPSPLQWLPSSWIKPAETVPPCETATRLFGSCILRIDPCTAAAR